MASECIPRKSSDGDVSLPGDPPGGPMIFQRLLAGLDLLSLSWEPFRDGVEIARIYRTGDDGPSAAFLRYRPGSRLERHLHTGYEHIFILSGSQIDDAGTHRAGTLLVNPPGTTHAIRSDEGCLVLAIWNSPVVFVPD